MKAKQNEKVMSNVKKKRLPAQSSKHREQGERVIWYRRIQFKLVASFMVPVLFIVILGLASYSKASQAIVRSYESSAGQTLNMMNQYLSVIVDSVQSKYKSYISDGDLSKYFTGMTVDSADIINTYKSYTTDFKGFLATDSTISNLYILSDTAASITTTSPEETALYSAYLATDAGVKCSNDIYSYYLFGNISSADETFGTSGNDYGLRLVRHTKGYKGFLVIDIKKSSVVKALSSLDPGTGGYVGIVTSDGTELLSDGTNPASPVFSNLECFEKVKENDESQGSEYIMYNGANYLFLYSKLEGRDAVLCALIPRSILTTQASDIKNLTLLLVIIAALAATTIGTIFARSMGRALTITARKVRQIADGDLTVSIKTRRKDEFLLLSTSIDTMSIKIKNLISKITEMSANLSDASRNVTETAGFLLDSSRQIQSSIKDIETGSSTLDTEAAGCLDQMENLSHRIATVQESAVSISAKTSETGNSVHSGKSTLGSLTESATATSKITQNVIQAIIQLEKKSQSIGNIISAMNEIAEQTNLLSLNASIEAARAGTAGRGFAVFAEEISKLAEQSHESAAHISSIVEEIAENTGEVVNVAKQAEDIVKKQEATVSRTSDSFNEIDDHISILISSLSKITENVQDMEDARMQTLNSIEGISAVSAETAAGSSSVFTATDAQLEEITSLEHAAVELSSRAAELNDLLTQFTI